MRSSFCGADTATIAQKTRRHFDGSQAAVFAIPAREGLTVDQHEAAIDAVIGASMWELRRRRVHSSEPSSGAPAEIARQGFPDRPSGFLRCPEHVPSPSRTLPKAAGTSNFSRSRPVLALLKGRVDMMSHALIS